MIWRTHHPGIYGEYVQYETARKFWITFSSLWYASVYSLGTAITDRDSKKLTTSNFPTYKVWYEFFMKGLHSEMGDDVRPDLAISVTPWNVNTLKN